MTEQERTRETWHKVTLKPQYPHLDREQVYVCDCGETAAVVVEHDDWIKQPTLHKGRWALDLEDEPILDAIIAEHEQARRVPELEREVGALRTAATEAKSVLAVLRPGVHIGYTFPNQQDVAHAIDSLRAALANKGTDGGAGHG